MVSSAPAHTVSAQSFFSPRIFLTIFISSPVSPLFSLMSVDTRSAPSSRVMLGFALITLAIAL